MKKNLLIAMFAMLMSGSISFADSPAIEWVGEKVTDVSYVVIDAPGKMIGEVVEEFGVVKPFFGWVGDKLVDSKNAVADAPKKVFEATRDATGEVFSAFRTSIGNVFNFVRKK